ncbi:hypothetical protein CYMTET_47298 [Cymbomonas tetramitiformis]|uniref:Uncharacterized protein n=1 Tax=Cymbomonas tetramitiformis TaxID=36881 RepID=A0AAE0BVV9_9CHLO|nr:hypothetical protein CYMTET_47298 [Cymbomonas tetramitiformis]
MLVSIVPFDTDSFVFPRMSRVDERSARLYVISEEGLEVPAVSASRETLDAVWCEGSRFEDLSRSFALMLLAYRIEDVADADRSCPLTMSLLERLDVVKRRFARWIESANLCFDGMLPRAFDETSETERDFRREVLLGISQLVRSDADRLRRFRRCSSSEIRVRVSA